jgi:DNA-binding XRE family transcriptional regulator
MRAGNVIYLRPRAARATKTSAPRPPPRAVSVSKIFAQHSAGTLSRCRHLEAVEGFTPISRAKALTEGQRPITSRNEEMERIECFLGHLTLESKFKVSRDMYKALGQPVPMRSSTDFRDAFIFRVRNARKASGLTQAKIAALLEIDQGTYKMYETRSMLPHDLIPRFCIACRIEVGDLYAETAARRRRIAS